ncbi:aminotransferase class V-fold PLP-dependent enzyme [Sneathiella limimaris]|uniref:aminotransferase class V-fold PLP-dependent enzyme n=1 Tax=Sneathiella limimaris TaxID=1964213 RepID=UPI00146D59EF|nr:aminotransferase class V-fold PLP-dependent enzyme [Sneathiella limimaris]
MLENKRHLFDIPNDIVYLNCAYMSPLSRSVQDAGERAIQQKMHPWTTSSEDFFGNSEKAKSMFAKLINGNTPDIAIIPSASYGLAIAAKNIEIQRGQKILVLEEQFPSNIYCWQERANETGAVVATVSAPEDKDWTAAILENIDDTVAVAALPNNHWADGGLLDLEKIGNQLRKVGAKLVLDVTQSLGVLPFDIEKVRPDFLVAAAYKWLMGPYSIGFMYVAPSFQNGDPIEYNWLNRAGSEDFSGLVRYQEAYQPGAVRFDMGQRANFQLLPMAIAALEQLLDWQPHKIYETIAQMNRTIATAANEIGLQSIPEALRAQHFLGLEKKGGFDPDLLKKLASRNIYLSMRGNSLRVTPHVYNTPEDTEKLITALRELV